MCELVHTRHFLTEEPVPPGACPWRPLDRYVSPVAISSTIFRCGSLELLEHHVVMPALANAISPRFVAISPAIRRTVPGTDVQKLGRSAAQASIRDDLHEHMSPGSPRRWTYRFTLEGDPFLFLRIQPRSIRRRVSGVNQATQTRGSWRELLPRGAAIASGQVQTSRLAPEARSGWRYGAPGHHGYQRA
jgi:hypothetical protein